MAKTLKLSDSEQVDQYITALDAALSEIVSRIRQIILSSDSSVGERIKWNHPSFYYTGEMKDFDPKEYKREIAVFNLFKGRIMLVFPSGARLADPAKLLQGNYTDGRRTLSFESMEHVKKIEKDLVKLIQNWIATVDR